MPSSESTCRERALRAAVLAGDVRAWHELYDSACVPLFAYLSWRCGGVRDLAEDVAQETWLIAVRRIRSFDPERAPFLGWLRGIAANLLRNRLRARFAPLSLEGDVIAPDGDRAQREAGEAIARALAELPERYEAVLRAKYLESQSVEQIAADRHETVKTVESLLARARQAFRAAYEHDDRTAFREAP
jgi:RNA polymerase sigma-70 factor (ECF subfamily)